MMNGSVILTNDKTRRNNVDLRMKGEDEEHEDGEDAGTIVTVDGWSLTWDKMHIWRWIWSRRTDNEGTLIVSEEN